ncbi:Clp protease N-terminal domain-containing protein [Pseudonocardia asaccharolytica]|uniref:Clp R domain-containing protein n=1 Tax=Pseudonocardia asaccharolytica DSM 44247 = NBRC 16224 TaxID=1123024 RepID=A0A511CYI7_9PSEU|nr:Clp protease N-terminal domain-containing protein [Pseudonocardia asaccharolytica]GEL17620.1 hypothetical protein PA7_14570 [Pseudonocardia asaccharolytica DSM 44247 = NBRC 16224]
MSAPQIRLDDLIDLVNGLHPDGDALAQLTDAVRLSERLGELADHLIGHFVDQARKAGATWTDIGKSMGVSKQAAQQRFVPKSDRLDLDAFTRFTDRARRVLMASQEDARGAGHDYIGTEHLVLGLLSEPEALAAKALAQQGINPEQVRAAMKVVLGPPKDSVPEHIPYTPRARKVIELTVREALRLGHNYVGTEHLLLGVLAEQEGVGAKVLVSLGLVKDDAEEWMLAQIPPVRKRPEAPAQE